MSDSTVGSVAARRFGYPSPPQGNTDARPGLWEGLALSACATYSAILVVIGMHQGPGVSADSVYYVHGAASFLATGEFTAFGYQLTLWPPGYPWVLSLVMAAGWSPEAAVVTLNVLCVVATVLLTYWIARVSTDNRAVALVSAAVVAVLPATVRTYSMMWTEPPFTVLVLATLLLLVSTARKGHLRPWHMVLVGMMVSFATLLRIAGVALIPLVVVGAFLATRSRPLVGRVTSSAVVAILSSVGLGAIALRNVSLGVPALGERTPRGLPLQNLMGHSLRALGRYVIPESGGLMPIEALAVQGAGSLVVMGATILVGVLLSLMLLLATVHVVRRRDLRMLVLALWVAVWWALLWYSVLTAGVDPPEDRLIAPALPAMTILLADWIATTTHGRPARPRMSALRATLVIWGVVSMTAGVMAATHAAHAGIGYNRVSIQGSPLVAALRSLPADTPVAATDAWLTYWASPRPTYSVFDDRFVPLAKAGKIQFIVFFRDSTGPRTPQSIIDDGVRLELVNEFTEGYLYRTVGE